MERLTEWDEFGSAGIVALSDMMPEIYAELSFSETNALTEALNRLAKYEDTGLEPNQAMLISNVLREVGETYNCWFDYVVNCVLENSHLKELAQAEKDGRLVVLDEPRKPLVWGDDTHDTILCPNCNNDLMGGFPEDEYCEKDMYQCPYCGQPIDSAKVLTREEAEAALKKREEADNETD